MKKFIFSLLLALISIPIGWSPAVAVSTPDQVNALFAEYGFIPTTLDLSWWSQNDKNQFGDLEWNLARRQKLASVPTIEIQTDVLGATIPKVVALFETSLQGKITTTATSMTLTDGTDKQGTSLSGVYGFIINEGASNEEFVQCTASGINLTGCLRGLDVTSGQTEVTALKKDHRRGESVKLTDFPILGILRNILNGQVGLPNFLYYDNASDQTTASSSVLAHVDYVRNVANQGAATSTPSVAGICHLASQLEIASSTYDALFPACVGTQYTTSTPAVGLYIPVTENDGKLNQGWLDLTENYSWSGQNTFSGINNFTATTTFATSTFNVLPTIPATPVATTDATSKGYVDTQDTALQNQLSLNWVGVGPTSNKTYINFQLGFHYTSASAVKFWTKSSIPDADTGWYATNVAPTSDVAYSYITTNGVFLKDDTNPAGWNYGKDFIAEFELSFNGTSGSEQTGWGFTEGTAPLQDYDSNTGSINFSYNTDGTVYAHTADGSNHTNTLLTGITPTTGFQTWRIEYNSGVDAKFYVNGVLKATITTTLPTSATAIKFGVGGTGNDNRATVLTAPRFAIEK